jgi:hypothetical protein
VQDFFLSLGQGGPRALEPVRLPAFAAVAARFTAAMARVCDGVQMSYARLDHLSTASGLNCDAPGCAEVRLSVSSRILPFNRSL